MEYTALLEKQILGRLRIDNPWWTEGCIPDYYKNMCPRLYLDIFYPLVKDLEVRRAILLMGPRRVGKTVMLFHSIQRLIDEGVSPQNIIYVSVETPIYNNIYLEQLLLLAKQALGKTDSREQFFVFFDEVQYLKDWEVNLKSLVDSYLNVKFVVSGSAAAELQKKSIESGAGRFTDFSLPPLLFFEYIHLKSYQSLMRPIKIQWAGIESEVYDTIDIGKLNTLFLEYINYGGYPEVALSERVQEDPGQFVRHDIVDKVLLRDLPSLYGISDVQELNSLFTMIAYHSGMLFSYESMSKESGVKKDVIRKYVQYLEAAFLIKVITRTDDTARRFQRQTTFKIYLTNPSLRCALFEPLKAMDENIGDMVETAVFSQWLPRRSRIAFANWKIGRMEGEVDLVGINDALQKPCWAVEIKWTNRFFENPQQLSSLKYFMQRNGLQNAIVTSVDQSGVKEMGFGKLYFMPAACYAYTVGENTLWQAKQSFGL